MITDLVMPGLSTERNDADTDSAPEETGFEPSVPLSGASDLGVDNEHYHLSDV